MINLTLTHKIFRKSKRKQIKAKLQIKKKTTNEENDKDEKTKPNMCKSSSSSEIRSQGRYVAAVVDERVYYTSEKQTSTNKTEKDRIRFAINSNP